MFDRVIATYRDGVIISAVRGSFGDVGYAITGRRELGTDVDGRETKMRALLLRSDVRRVQEQARALLEDSQHDH